MLSVVQRVAQASVTVDGAVVGAIGRGLLVLVCAQPGDTDTHGERLVEKLLRLRIFADDAGKMNRSVQDIAGGLLLVSQFTLAADLSRGNRPSFVSAAPPELARTLFDRLVAVARQRHQEVATGIFGANMQVSLINDGPVTLPLQV